MKVSKMCYSHYSLRGITLGDKGNFCGHTGVEVVAIDYNSESVLLTGFKKDSVTIKELSKKELDRVYYTKKAKKNEYSLWISIDAIEKYNANKEEAVKEEEINEEKEYDKYEFNFNDFIKAVKDGDVDDGDEFDGIKLECSSSVISNSKYNPSISPKNIKVFTVEHDFSNAYQILSENCNMHDGEELEKILNSTSSYIYIHKTVTEEIINDLYLNDNIYAYEKMNDGRIVIIVLK